MKDLNELIKLYKTSKFKDNNKVSELSDIGFCAFLWQLNNGHFEIVPYSDVSFLRYFLIGCDNSLFIINTLLDQRNNIEIKLFS